LSDGSSRCNVSTSAISKNPVHDTIVEPAIMYLYLHIICFDFGCSFFGPLGENFSSHLYRSKSLSQLFCFKSNCCWFISCRAINEPRHGSDFRDVTSDHRERSVEEMQTSLYNCSLLLDAQILQLARKVTSSDLYGGSICQFWAIHEPQSRRLGRLQGYSRQG